MASTDLLTRIKGQYLLLSKSHKKIADFILENSEKVAFMTASRLGREVNISESTVVRFASAVGYKGYPELQSELQDAIKNRLTTVQRFERSKDSEHTFSLKKVIFNDLENIKHTLEEIEDDVFDHFINEIIRARKVYILGLRSSSVLANYLGFYLNYVLYELHIIQESAQDVYDQLLNMTDQDVLIVYSFPRYSKRTYDCVDYAIKNNTTILGITDCKSSPLYPYSKYCLVAKYTMDTFIDSFVAPMSLTNAIIVGVGMKKDGAKDSLNKLENIWKDYNVYNLK